MNSQIGLKEAWEIMASYDPTVWFGVLTAVVVFAIEIVLHKKKKIFSGDEIRIERAKKQGHVIKAQQVTCRYYDKKSGLRNYVAVYEYEVDGITHTKTVTTRSRPPLTIRLYYDKSPNKVFSDFDIGSSPLKILMYVIPIIAAFIVMKAMGFNG